MEAADIQQAVEQVSAIGTRADSALSAHANLKPIVEDLVKRVTALESQKAEAKVAPAPVPVPVPAPAPAKTPEVVPIKP